MIQRYRVEGGESGGWPVWQSTWTEPDRDGEYVRWQDVADLIVNVHDLLVRIDLAHDLHAVFTINDSAEFQKLKVVVSEVLRA